MGILIDIFICVCVHMGISIGIIITILMDYHNPQSDVNEYNGYFK